MKKSIIFLFSMLVSLQSLANQWFGDTWKLKSLYCPFSCSDSIKQGFEAAKSQAIMFAADKVVLPKIIGVCSSPTRPDWGSVQKTKLKSYLQKWSNNEAALKAPKIRSSLAKSIGMSASASVHAGVVHCDNGESFNLISVNEHKAFLLFEENAYFELFR